ncbi:serine/threonine protein kinase [Acinetobacter pullicarnis]|uniref:serine/threonine protein kinase n=1 Tax=Acinetobacter pullicarnis TaxID=2576829 RepID=UPI00111D1E27|nr:protein kinase [Acinetobacter pullicarnis]
MLNLKQLYQTGTAVNPIQSQQLGRYLYLIDPEAASQSIPCHWLKLQQQGVNSAYERSFMHELQCYADLNRLEAEYGLEITLPFRVLEASQTLDFPDGFVPQALLLGEASAHFNNATLLALASSHFSDVGEQQLLARQHSKILHHLIQSSQVLAHLHHVGYLHGDLKPEHFRTQAGQCYLIDFEQATRIDLAKPLSHAATPRYMAPELFHGEAKSQQSDIYALGIIWYEWLTQRRIQHKTYLDWAKWHCQHFQIELSPQFQPLMAVLKRMLCKNKANRYANIHEIKQGLSRIV